MDWFVILTLPPCRGLLGPVPQATLSFEIQAETPEAARDAAIAKYAQQTAGHALRRGVSLAQVVAMDGVTTFTPRDGWDVVAAPSVSTTTSRLVRR